MKNRIGKVKQLKRLVISGVEKEIYKTSIPAHVKYTVGDGGEYTREEAVVMSHLYNNGKINTEWLLEDIKRVYGFDSLQAKNVLHILKTDEEWVVCSVSEVAIKKTVVKPISIVRENRGTGLTIDEMNELDRMIGNG